MPLFDHRICVFDFAGQNKNTGIGLKTKAGVVAQMGLIDVQGTAEVVAHEEDRPAAFVGRVFRQDAAAQLKGEGVTVVVNSRAAYVRALIIAVIIEKAAVDDLEAPAAHKNRPTPPGSAPEV